MFLLCYDLVLDLFLDKLKKRINFLGGGGTKKTKTKEKFTEHKMCFDILSETYLILRINERNMIKDIYIYWSSCKVSVVLARC